jgi:hypothetical protein
MSECELSLSDILDALLVLELYRQVRVKSSRVLSAAYFRRDSVGIS